MKLVLRTLLPSMAIVFALTLMATDAMAQGRGGNRGGGGQIDSSRLLRSESVRKEIELTDDQMEAIEEMAEEGRDRGRGFNREDFEGLSQEERIAKFREIRDAQTKETKERLEEILLPHQMERLSQIGYQLSSQNGISGALAAKLGITEEQEEELKEKSAELLKDFNEEVAKLREEMKTELISAVLTKEQQKQYKELVGEPFRLERTTGGRGDRTGGRGGDRGTDRGGRGGDRGGRGGRGGDRGGDRGNDRGDDF